MDEASERPIQKLIAIIDDARAELQQIAEDPRGSRLALERLRTWEDRVCEQLEGFGLLELMNRLRWASEPHTLGGQVAAINASLRGRQRSPNLTGRVRAKDAVLASLREDIEKRPDFWGTKLSEAKVSSAAHPVAQPLQAEPSEERKMSIKERIEKHPAYFIPLAVAALIVIGARGVAYFYEQKIDRLTKLHEIELEAQQSKHEKELAQIFKARGRIERSEVTKLLQKNNQLTEESRSCKVRVEQRADLLRRARRYVDQDLQIAIDAELKRGG